jgi:glycosyltransferase involved in cell wall biosynthesis
MARRLVAHGHEATVVCASDDTRTAGDSVVDGVRVVRLAGGDFAVPHAESARAGLLKGYLRTVARYRSYREKIADRLEDLTETGRADIVEFPEYGNEAAVWMERKPKTPWIVRLHTPTMLDRKTVRRIQFRPHRWLRYRRAKEEYRALFAATAISACSGRLAEWVRRDADLGNRTIRTIYNPVDADAWARRHSTGSGQRPPPVEGPRAATGGAARESGRRRVVFAGSLVPSKGVPELVEAVRLLGRQGRRVDLALAGRGGAYARKLGARLRRDRELSPRVELRGFVTREALKGLYADASVVCLPSWWEALPMACLEAMASGAIVVGSSAGGMPEIIRDSVDGFLVPPRDHVALAERLAEALDMDAPRRLEMKRQALRRVQTTFDAGVIVPQMLEFYEDVISGKTKGVQPQMNAHGR